MAVTNTYTDSTLYTGNGATTAFSTRFLFSLDAEVLVYKVTIADGTETLQTITTHYTLTGAGTGSAGTVTFLAAPSSSYYVKIVRSTAKTQTTDYVEGTKFPAAVHEAALDKLTRLVQEVDRDTSRSPRLPVSSINYPAVFPDYSSATGGYILRVNSGGTALELATPTDAALISSLTPTDGGFIVGDGSGFVVETGATARTSLGLGTIATQAASAVAITGGTVVGITDLALADGGTGASTASAARTNLGLGTMAVQDANNVTITGGSIAGVTGVQLADAELTAIAGLTSAADKGIMFTGSGTAATYTLTAAALTVLDDATVSAMVDTLGGAAAEGTGAIVRKTGATLVTPTLGVASATTVNKVAITAPATGSTLTIADGKTLTVSNTLTFTGTDASSAAFGAGGTVAYTANKLSAFAATTSAELAGVISDETGSGALVFANTPTLVTPVLGAATATSINGIVPTAATTTVGANIALPEGTNNGAHVVKMKAADSMAADYTIEWPAAAPGGNGYTLSFTTAGVATFTAPGAAAAGGAATNVQFNTGGVLAGDSGFIYGSGIATLTTGLVVGGNATAAGYVDFKEDTDNGTNRARLAGPASTADVTITLPASTGTVVLEDNAVALTAKTGYNSAVITAPTTTVGGNIKLLEGTNNGTNTITLQAPASTADVTATFQAVTGTVALSADVPVAAAQSDQETSTSTVTYVSPGRQHFHPSAAKVWASWTCVTTTTLKASYNMTSLTDNGTGDTTATIATDFSAVDTYAIATATRATSSTTGVMNVAHNVATTAGVFRFESMSNSLALADNPENYFVAFGDQ